MRRRRRSVTDGARFTAHPGPPEPPKARLDQTARSPSRAGAGERTNPPGAAVEEAAQLARARRVGRELSVVNRSDYGPGIRLAPVRGLGGAVLCDADVVVDDGTDPGQWIVHDGGTIRGYTCVGGSASVSR